MSDNANEKEKKCIVCKKKLIDEKIPICLRCKLSGKKKASNIGKKVAGIGAGVVAVATIIGNIQNNSDEDLDSDNYSEDD